MQRNKRRDGKVKSNESPQIPDRRGTLVILATLRGSMTNVAYQSNDTSDKTSDNTSDQ